MYGYCSRFGANVSRNKCPEIGMPLSEILTHMVSTTEWLTEGNLLGPSNEHLI